MGPPDSKSLVLAYWLEEPANHVRSGRGLGAQEAGDLELSLHPTWLCSSDCLGFSFSLCAMGPAVGPHLPILGCHTVPRGGVTQTTMSYRKVTEAESQGRRTGMRQTTSTHLGHRRPSASWNPAKTPSRPACGFQRAHQGHRSSAPLGTCPAGLGE